MASSSGWRKRNAALLQPSQQDGFGSCSSHKTVPPSTSCCEHCTAVHLYQAAGLIYQGTTAFSTSEAEDNSATEIRIVLKNPLVTHICRCLPQTAKHRAEENKRKRISWGNATALWCHALLGLQHAVLAALPNTLSSFTFLHSLDGMESSSESSAMEEAHGDEQGSLSSSARKLFALWEKICSHEMRFFPTALYSLSFPPSSALSALSAWSTVTILPYFNFLLLKKRIFMLAMWVVPTDPGSSGSFPLQDSRRN